MSLTRELPGTANGRKRWSRAEFEFLENACLLKGRYELLDGEIITKMGQNRRHARVLSLLLAYLAAAFGAERVQSQATMEVREDDRILNRPEPDAAVLREDIDRNASGEDVLLAVEVSDTTQADDYGHKVALYARAGVAEYWVLDLNRRLLTAFRRPQEGRWLVRDDYAEGDTVSPLSAPQSVILVSELLPPRA